MSTTATRTYSVNGVSVVDTLDDFYELAWEFRGRTYWACADGRVRYAEDPGVTREVTARASLDLDLDVDWRLGRRAYAAECHRRIVDWLVTHHHGTYATA